MLQAIEIQKIIESNLKCNYIKVTGVDGTNFDAVIVSHAFINQSMIKQHQQVYSALGNMMQKEIHALSIKTFTPDDWNQIK